MEPAAEVRHANLLAEVYQDDDSMNPRNADNLGVLGFEALAERDCGLSEVNLGSLDFDDLVQDCPACEGTGEMFSEESGETEQCGRCDGDADIADDVEGYFTREYDAAVLIPIRFADYGSGGSTIYREIDEPNGVIFVTNEKLAAEDMTPEEGLNCLESELEELDCWLQQEAWGYVVKNEDGSEIEPALVGDSCWGFIARFERGEGWQHLISECKDACEYVRKCLDKEATEQANWAARDVVTTEES